VCVRVDEEGGGGGDNCQNFNPQDPSSEITVTHV
jgi:hypothetical protein